MFGVSFLEIALVALVALVVVGPQKLPEMMRTAGEWLGKLRRLTADMRVQTGIDDILREEGIDGVGELRTLLRGERGLANRARTSRNYGYETNAEPPDLSVEFPSEGPDARGALPDDLLSDDVAQTEPKQIPTSVADSRPSTPTRASTNPAKISSPPRPSSSIPQSTMTKKPPLSIPPPPTEARRAPPRATTHRETPKSKSEPEISISQAPPALLKKDEAQ